MSTVKKYKGNLYCFTGLSRKKASERAANAFELLPGELEL